MKVSKENSHYVISACTKFEAIKSNVKIIALYIQLKVNTEKRSSLGYMNQNKNMTDSSKIISW